jgi:long-chain acyl-CoA synthetase
VLGFNRPEWCIFDHGTMAAGGAPAGIYTTSSGDEIVWLVNHADARVLVLENAVQWGKIAARLGEMPKLEKVVFMRGETPAHPQVLAWEAFLALGDAVADSEVTARIAALDPQGLATFIYTSGTTGLPKGVMLSHDNLAWTAAQVADVIDPKHSDSVISYLPLSHIAEQIFSLHGPATFGFCVNFAESIEKLPENLKEVRPTLFFAVPRIWEKFHAGVSGKLAQATGVKKALAGWALSVGERAMAERMRGKAPGSLLGLQERLAEKLVLSKVRAALGLDRTNLCMSGAAPVGADVLRFLAKIGLCVLEVYGQSEGTGPSTVTRHGNTVLGTVGPPYPGVEVKLAADGEILVKGRNVFLGYFKEPAATAETLVEGWLHSGDLGAFDAAGNLNITGRKKEIIITAGGKNVAPKLIEGALKEHALIAEAVIIGDRRRFISALLCLNPDEAQKHAPAALEAAVSRIVDEVNTKIARVEQVRKFTILPRPLGLEQGELTPTLKIKRSKVASNWAKEIEAMYAGDAEQRSA